MTGRQLSKIVLERPGNGRLGTVVEVVIVRTSFPNPLLCSLKTLNNDLLRPIEPLEKPRFQRLGFDLLDREIQDQLAELRGQRVDAKLHPVAKVLRSALRCFDNALDLVPLGCYNLQFITLTIPWRDQQGKPQQQEHGPYGSRRSTAVVI
jgi:hypothetical protein